MAKRYDCLSETHIEFIARQKIFFVGTATADSKVNISPKGMDSFRVLNKNRAIWLNVTGSGNETAAHVRLNPRMTVMFCAFEGPPLILRLYGTATAVHPTDADWQNLLPQFGPLPGARQIFDLSIDLVLTSCGMAVPNYSYENDRTQLNDWARKKGDEGILQYWQEKNRYSVDGIDTNIINEPDR